MAIYKKSCITNCFGGKSGVSWALGESWSWQGGGGELAVHSENDEEGGRGSPIGQLSYTPAQLQVCIFIYVCKHR